jgi:hypothetical protein
MPNPRSPDGQILVVTISAAGKGWLRTNHNFSHLANLDMVQLLNWRNRVFNVYFCTFRVSWSVRGLIEHMLLGMRRRSFVHIDSPCIFMAAAWSCLWAFKANAQGKTQRPTTARYLSGRGSHMRH